MNSFAKSISDRLALSGIKCGELISSPKDMRCFGDNEVVCRFGSMILRFTEDRGQEFLAIAFNDTPNDFFVFDDVEIAMGWKTIEEVLSKAEPDPLLVVLQRFAAHEIELVAAFSGAGARFARARVGRAEHLRGVAFVERLRQLSKNWDGGS